MTCASSIQRPKEKKSQNTIDLNLGECENLETKGKQDALSFRITTNFDIPRYDIVRT